MIASLSQNLQHRIFGALLLLPPVVYLIYLGGLWFTGLLMVGGVFMVLEWHKMTRVPYWVIQLSSICFVWATCLFGYLLTPETPIALILAGMALPLLLVLTAVTNLGEHQSPILHIIRWSCNGALYVALPLFSLAWIRGIGGDEGWLYVLWTFLIVWAADVGGYFFGKGFGGPKLAPSISPKKTWAGFLGGVILSIFISWVLAEIINYEALWGMISTAVLISIVSQMGDLFESLIKRAFGVKDSGALIPGHGGILDRVDGLVFAAPAMAVILDIYVAN